MIDPDEIAAYNEWKAIKVAGAQDLSIEAFNTEMGMQAAAFDKGVDAALKHIFPSDDFKAAGLVEIAEITKTDSPFRKPGMRGHTP